MKLNMKSLCVYPGLAKMRTHHHDDAWSHTLLAEKCFGKEKHAYHFSPRLKYYFAPSDCFEFLKIKAHLNGHHFSAVEKTQSTPTRALNSLSGEDFQHYYEEYQCCWNYVQSKRIYFEGDQE